MTMAQVKWQDAIKKALGAADEGADAGTGDRFGFLFRPLVSAPA